MVRGEWLTYRRPCEASMKLPMRCLFQPRERRQQAAAGGAASAARGMSGRARGMPPPVRWPNQWPSR